MTLDDVTPGGVMVGAAVALVILYEFRTVLGMAGLYAPVVPYGAAILAVVTGGAAWLLLTRSDTGPGESGESSGR